MVGGDYEARMVGNWLTSAKEDRFGDGGAFREAFSVLMESKPRLYLFVSLRFLHANRCPLRLKML